MAVIRKRPTTWYPRPHESVMATNFNIGFGAGTADTTIFPAIMYDEGKGDPASYNANPDHASFASTGEPNCYPESRIEKVFCEVEVWMTLPGIETDKLRALRYAFMPIFTSFEDIDAKDEKSGDTIGTILELQTESTDRQCYPLWTGTDMSTLGYNDDLPTNVPGLTTNQVIESVAFDAQKYYDCLQYYSNAGKMKKCQGGLNWRIITRNQVYQKFRISLRSKNKTMVPYSFFGLLLHCPGEGSIDQLITTVDTSSIAHITMKVTTRYNEWNENFDFARQ